MTLELPLWQAVAVVIATHSALGFGVAYYCRRKRPEPASDFQAALTAGQRHFHR